MGLGLGLAFHSSMVRMRKTYVRVRVRVRVKMRETVMKASMKVSNAFGEPPPSASASSKSNLPPKSCMPRMAKMNMKRMSSSPM